MSIDNMLRELIANEVRRLVRNDALVEGTGCFPDDLLLREKARATAARLRRGGGQR